MTQPTAWAHLPNAAHIDGVLASLRAHPERWGTAWTSPRDAARSAARSAAWNVARGTAWSVARSAARDATRYAVWNAVWSAAWSAAWNALRSAAWVVAGDVIAALIAYGDAGQFMKLPVEQLRAMYRLDPHPMYLLLQPAAVIFAGD